METKYIEELNDAQRDAVVNVDGPSLVIAGAGSGKTRVLTYRIAYLLSQGCKAQQILALTFTNKAAREMKERISKLVGYDKSKYLWMGTFHSIFARMLRTEGSALGFTSNYTIYDTLDAKNILKNIVKELRLDEKVYTPGEVLSRISSAKNNLVTPQAYASNPEISRQDAVNRKSMMAEIYKIYVNRCRKADAMDFDDLLLNTNILLRDFPDVLRKYQELFRYILVDEYQDTNYAQYLIVNKLAALHHNVSVVGDDAQSIYSFRGAKIENILNFRKDYPESKLYKLEQNYRSTQTIVNAANSLISKNKDQIQKKVWSNLEAGEKIKVVQTATDNEEGFITAGSILDTHLSLQASFNEFAILYRTNAQSRIFEEALRKKNIPYKVYGSLSFYQRKEIKDLLAYFRFSLNQKDEESLRRIINYPARGIGDTTLDKITQYAAETNRLMWEVIKSPGVPELGLNRGIQGKLTAFAEMIEGFVSRLDTSGAYEMAMQIATGAGILQELKHDKSPENISRYENIEELLNSIGEFVDINKEEGFVSLARYLENVSLLTDQDNDKDEDLEKVSIMTIHAAKGLEFSYVFLAGLEEELFPNKMSVGNLHDLEEERRLFYVGLTRAKKQATISYSEMRYKWGTPNFCKPSRFIADIDARYLEMKEEEPRGRQSRPSFPGMPDEDYFETKKAVKPPVMHPQRRLVKLGSSAPSPSPSVPGEAQTAHPGSIQTGTRVFHERFGTGTVTAMEGSEPNIKATVAFDQGETKQLLLKFAKLKVLPS